MIANCIACGALYTGAKSRDGWGTCPVHARRRDLGYSAMERPSVGPKTKTMANYRELVAAQLRRDIATSVIEDSYGFTVNTFAEEFRNEYASLVYGMRDNGRLAAHLA